MIDVVLGLQWGDEGKGKIADFLTPRYDLVARFQGGPNAGHSLAFNDKKVVLNTIPSGIFHETCLNVIGNGVVVDPVRIKEEIARVQEMGGEPIKNLVFSRKATIILPTHRVLDAASEFARGEEKIGSTLRGITPAYRDKIGRTALFLGEIFSDKFIQHYEELKRTHLKYIGYYGYKDFDLAVLEKEFFAAIEFLKDFKFDDTEYLVNESCAAGKKVLAEGAQGSMLDIDFGSYPFVTSSNTISGGVCNGLGVAPNKVHNVSGIFKAYCTRVGSGPFPTELDNEIGETLRKNGFEFGATTGRPRRCGWLDLVALKYAIMLSGVNKLIMMKADVLSGMETLNVCTHYIIDGKRTDRFPTNLCNAKVEPVYKEFKGWKEDISICKTVDELPQTFRDYIQFIETFTGVKVHIISVGPDREQTILNHN
ncbi:MAG: adenylosuccinate synthase [Bacteroidia bacterium]|nr:adenylosuccinate synthase [Bacteroidia bacterium]MCO5254753.1 adenylosuccinate synthase [Bacteroidota bacterium]